MLQVTRIVSVWQFKDAALFNNKTLNFSWSLIFSFPPLYSATLSWESKTRRGEPYQFVYIPLICTLPSCTPFTLPHCLPQGWNWGQEKGVRVRKVLPSLKKMLSGVADNFSAISAFIDHREINSSKDIFYEVNTSWSPNTENVYKNIKSQVCISRIISRQLS